MSRYRRMCRCPNEQPGRPDRAHGSTVHCGRSTRRSRSRDRSGRRVRCRCTAGWTSHQHRRVRSGGRRRRPRARRLDARAPRRDPATPGGVPV